MSSILDPDRIEAEVNKGVVILKGKVSFYREKIMAQTVASWQEGVKGLINEIKVLPPKKAKSDENLRDILQAILDAQFSLEKNVYFEIEDGVVTLNGATKDLWFKERIEEEFANVIGVKKVINNLKVEPLSKEAL